VAAFRQLLTGSAPPSAQEQVVCLREPGRGVPRPDSYSAQRADNWRSQSPRAATKMLEPKEVVVVISTGWMSCAGRRPTPREPTTGRLRCHRVPPQTGGIVRRPSHGRAAEGLAGGLPCPAGSDIRLLAVHGSGPNEGSLAQSFLKRLKACVTAACDAGADRGVLTPQVRTPRSQARIVCRLSGSRRVPGSL